MRRKRKRTELVCVRFTRVPVFFFSRKIRKNTKKNTLNCPFSPPSTVRVWIQRRETIIIIKKTSEKIPGLDRGNESVAERFHWKPPLNFRKFYRRHVEHDAVIDKIFEFNWSAVTIPLLLNCSNVFKRILITSEIKRKTKRSTTTR